MLGKYGAVRGTKDGEVKVQTEPDPTLSLDPASSNSIIGRSVVIHGVNGARIGCANILPVKNRGLGRGRGACPRKSR